MLPALRAASASLRVSGRRTFVVVSRPCLQAADKDAQAKAVVYDVDPSNPEIAPSVIPWKQFKNEYFEKRGYTVAGKDWKEWPGLPAPYKYLGVKVNPEHVEKQGMVWKFFSDWRTAIPASILLSLPLWMFNYLPPVDERFELALITIGAGWIMIGQAGPMFRAFKRSRVATKVKAMLQAEKDLNDTIVAATNTYAAGAKMPESMRVLNSAERALRREEAAAASVKLRSVQRDAIAEQLNYLVNVASAGAADNAVAITKAARAATESALETDAALQGRTIAAAIKSLTDGTLAEDVVSPVYAKALAQAKADLAARPASNPLLSPAQVDLFKKRFGYSEDSVSADTLARASSSPATFSLLKGRVGGKTPAVGVPYTLRAPITYVKAAKRA